MARSHIESWLRRWWPAFREPGVLLAVLIVMGGLWVVGELSAELMEGDLRDVDQRILSALRESADPRTPIGPTWVLTSALDITALGSTTILLLLTGAVTCFLVLCRARHMVILLLATTVGGMAITYAAKEAFDRPRPQVVPHLIEVQLASYPSGHSSMSAVVYLTLAVMTATLVRSRRLKLYLIGVALLLTALVGCSRVYLGVHYPSDVLAGWSMGLAWALLCWIVARLLQARGTVDEKLDPE